MDNQICLPKRMGTTLACHPGHWPGGDGDTELAREEDMKVWSMPTWAGRLSSCSGNSVIIPRAQVWGKHSVSQSH